MADLVIPNTFVANTLIESADVNENFQTIAGGAFNKAGDTCAGDATFLTDVDVLGDLTVTGAINGTLAVDASELTGTTLPAAVVTSSLTTVGTIASGTWSATLGAVSGASLTNLNASALDAGTVPLAQLSGLTVTEFASPNVSQWTNDSGYLTSASAASIPTGAILMWGSNTAPTDWLLCNGTGYSTAVYPALFAIIGYTYGGAAGTFYVPNFTQRFPLGKSGGAEPGALLGQYGGAMEHQHTLYDHTHTVTATTDATVTLTGGGSDTVVTSVTGTTSGDGSGLTEYEGIPRYLTVNFIIRT